MFPVQNIVFFLKYRPYFFAVLPLDQKFNLVLSYLVILGASVCYSVCYSNAKSGKPRKSEGKQKVSTFKVYCPMRWRLESVLSYEREIRKIFRVGFHIREWIIFKRVGYTVKSKSLSI